MCPCVLLGLLTICGLVNSQHAVCKMKEYKFVKERDHYEKERKIYKRLIIPQDTKREEV